MKVLYVGNFRDGTGWSHAALNYVLALDAAGVDVVPRTVKLNSIEGEVPERFAELEKKSSTGSDVVIQNILPHLMEYSGKFQKNIALYTSETTNFKSSSWPDHINLMSEAWVMSDQSREASTNSGVNVPVRVVPVPCNITKFQQNYTSLPFREEFPDDFIFYSVGEINSRKNLAALIKAFHLEFDPEEPVQLVIKTTPVGLEKGVQGLKQYVDEIKRNLKIGRASEEIYICGQFSELDMMRLHSSCDCFVSASHGEAFCIPAFEAMALGKAIVAPRFGGFLEYLNDENSWLVEGRLEPVWGATDTFPFLYTGRESWFSVSINSLQTSLRSAYADANLRKEKTKKARASAYNFTYEKIGTKMKDFLCE